MLLAGIAALAIHLGGALPPAQAALTTRASVSSAGAQANGYSFEASINWTGCHVAFSSAASNLVADDLYPGSDIFLRDRCKGATEQVSKSATGGAPDGESSFPSLSADARYVAFMSAATNLIAGQSDTDGEVDCFVRDRLTAKTEQVSVSRLEEGTEPGRCLNPSLSAGGRFVVFAYDGTDLVEQPTPAGVYQVYLYDRQTKLTTLVSATSTGEAGDGWSYYPSASVDGRYIAFTSSAANLGPAPDANGYMLDVLVWDRKTGNIQRADVSAGGEQANGPSFTGYAPVISADGRRVAFSSYGTNLVAAGTDTNNDLDVFVRDRTAGTTVRASVASGGAQALGYSSDPSISANGRSAGFTSTAANLVPGDTNGQSDAFVHELTAHATERVSVSTVGTQANGLSSAPVLSWDGQQVAFDSGATNLVLGDTNGLADVFVRIRGSSAAPAPKAGGIRAHR